MKKGSEEMEWTVGGEGVTFRPDDGVEFDGDNHFATFGIWTLPKNVFEKEPSSGAMTTDCKRCQFFVSVNLPAAKNLSGAMKSDGVTSFCMFDPSNPSKLTSPLDGECSEKFRKWQELENPDTHSGAEAIKNGQTNACV